jgi:hypothetical protein
LYAAGVEWNARAYATDERETVEREMAENIVVIEEPT